MENSDQELLSLLKETIQKGGRIGIYGWLGSNHTQETRRLEKTGKVLFFERKNNTGRVSGDIVLSTRFVGHKDTQRLKKHVSYMYPHALDVGHIRRLLSECETVISKKVIRRRAIQEKKFDVEAPQKPSLEELEETIMQTEVKMDEYDKLAQRFKESGGTISTKNMAIALSELGLRETPRALVKAGWLRAITGEGKQRIGWYTMGPKLEERATQDKLEEPTGPIDKALFLINQKDAITKKIAEVEEALKQLKNQLERVTMAEALLQQLSDL